MSIEVVTEADVGRRVNYVNGQIKEPGVIRGLCAKFPGMVMVSFGGCAPERTDPAHLTWGRGREK